MRIVWVAVALVVAALLTFPVGQRGECRDSSDPELSVCESWTTSLLGVPTSYFAWVIVSIIAVAVVWFGRRMPRAASPD